MSDKSNTNDEGQGEDYCNLNETEQYAFKLAIKEIIRETVDVSDADSSYPKGKNYLIDKIDADNAASRIEDGVYRFDRIKYDLCDRNDVFAAVADNPIVELAKVDNDAAILVHADYLDEFYAAVRAHKSEGEE
ncbi:hypothetical protein OSG_eHP24_00010 [environmental Halophage eHP-24]|jgi:hypothetical protein|nr:hypothetical protein OSG_eHP24_00010 [environmental Halophage eHP-24]